nr:hypothetical protein CFP56_09442 [Quercus suber]
MPRVRHVRKHKNNPDSPGDGMREVLRPWCARGETVCVSARRCRPCSPIWHSTLTVASHSGPSLCFVRADPDGGWKMGQIASSPIMCRVVATQRCAPCFLRALAGLDRL